MSDRPDITLTEDHRYIIRGVEYPGVTSVLKSVGIIDYDCIPEKYRELGMTRGRIVHRLTELDDLGTLDPDTVDERVKPFLEAYRSFKHDTGFVAVELEQMVYSHRYGFCGMLDKTGLANFTDKPILLDIKTNALPWWLRLQLAGYSIAKKEIEPAIEYDRYGLSLKATGKYKLSERYSGTKDEQDFLACLHTLRLVTQKR